MFHIRHISCPQVFHHFYDPLYPNIFVENVGNLDSAKLFYESSALWVVKSVVEELGKFMVRQFGQ